MKLDYEKLFEEWVDMSIGGCKETLHFAIQKELDSNSTNSFYAFCEGFKFAMADINGGIGGIDCISAECFCYTCTKNIEKNPEGECCGCNGCYRGDNRELDCKERKEE